MSKLAMTALSISLQVPPAQAIDGLIAIPSAYSAKSSMDRLGKMVEMKGLEVIARIDHSAGAHSIGQELRPTELMIFGHTKGETPLLQCAQSFGIDLPMRVLAWEDEKGRAWLGYRDPVLIGHFRFDADCDTHVRHLTILLDTLVREAAMHEARPQQHPGRD